MILTGLIFGFLGSLHCVGMCGSIVLSLPLPSGSWLKKILGILLYHFGRIFSYALLGLLFGTFGRAFALLGVQRQLSIAIGIGMIVVVVIPRLTKHIRLRWYESMLFAVRRNLGVALREQGRLHISFLIGFFNGLLPCGFVYMALVGSLATQEAFLGASYMALFGIGTIPLTTGVIYIGSMLNGSKFMYWKHLSSIIVVFIGVLFVLRGLGLGIPYVSPSIVDAKKSEVIGCP